MKTLKLKDGIEVPVKASSERYKLSWRDAAIGCGMAFATPIVSALYEALMAWLNYSPVEIDYREMIKIGISAAVAYLGKNFFDSGKIVISQTAYKEAKK